MTQDRPIKQNTLFGKTAKRAVALLLCLLTLLPSLTTAVSAASQSHSTIEPTAGTPTSNTYLLALSVGERAGVTIQYVNIRYMDTDGVARSELIFPHQDGITRSFDTAAAVSSQLARHSIIKTVTDYTVADYSKLDGLTAYTQDMYMVKLPYQYKSLIRIEAYGIYSDGVGGALTITDLRFYRVDQLYGLKMYGYCSEKRYVDFSGELLYMLNGSTVDLNYSRMSHLFTFGPEDCEHLLVTPDKWVKDMWVPRQSPSPSSDEIKKHTQELVNYNSHDDPEYFLRFDIADEYGAGIEAFANDVSDKRDYNAALGKMHLPETLIYSVTYTDIYGRSRRVYLPIVTSYVAWLADNTSAAPSWSINGLFQQGESVFFPAALPDFASISKIVMINDGEGDVLTGLISSGSGRLTSRLDDCSYSLLDQSTGDDLSITGFSMFEASKAVPDVRLEDAMLRAELGGTPYCYFTSNSSSGVKLKYGGSAQDVSSMLTYPKEGDDFRLTPLSVSSSYIVELETDTVMNAGTKADLFIKLRYLSKSGIEKTTDTINVREAVSGFLGYWPGDGGDYSYYSGADSGGKLAFPINYNDIDYFIGATLMIDKGSSDEWQMAQLKIYRIDSVSSRFAKWGSVSIGSNSSDRYIYRIYDTSKCVRKYDSSKILLHQRDDTKTISFDGGGEVIREEVEWDKYKYSMSYEDALQDFGFSDVRCKYEVQVKVRSNDAAETLNGDCGSLNKFFFQLIFNNGRSSYVLANQQLNADGFRAGQTESFFIYTNRNYGELSAVHIIPDDISTDAQPYDKLNIDSISVIHVNQAGVNRTWNINNVGWVGIDYQDEGIKESFGGQPGRSEGELARSFSVNSSGYTVSFLVAVAVDSYKDNILYDGGISADIHYYDKDNNRKTYSVDVAAAMYDYAEREKPERVEIDGISTLPIDNSYMFAPGKTSRFEVNIPDVQWIDDIYFYGCAKNTATEMLIKDVDIYQILSKGTLELNKDGEYQRADEIDHICNDVSSGVDTFYIHTGGDPTARDYVKGKSRSEVMIQMNKTVINVNTEDSSWEAEIEKYPENYDDSLNIYVYMSDGAASITNYDMSATVDYQYRTEDKPYQLGVQTMKKSTSGGRDLFYYKGLSTMGMTNLNSMVLKAQSAYNPSALVDYAIVEHIRSGVVISTYRLEYYNQNASFTKLKSSPTATEATVPGKQVVTLQFSDDTREAALSGNITDVAVSIRYKTTNDLSNTSYNSRTVTLASQDINRIYAGKTVSVSFEEKYLKEITGLTLQSVGNVSATVEKACIGVYEADADNNIVCTGWYNFGRSSKLSYSSQTLSVSSRNVVPLTVAFTTADAQSEAESGTTTPVRMLIGVTTREGMEKTIEVPDITQYISSGSLATGKTAVVDLLLSDIREIRSLTLEPYDSSSSITADWTVASLEAVWKIEGNEMAASRVIDRTIYESEPFTVNLSNVKVLLNAIMYDENGSPYNERNIIGKTDSIIIKSGHSVLFTPNIQGTLSGYGYTVTVEQVAGDDVDLAGTYIDNDKEIRFNPPLNNTPQDTQFLVTVASSEVPAAFAAFNVTVKTSYVSTYDPIGPQNNPNGSSPSDGSVG